MPRNKPQQEFDAGVAELAVQGEARVREVCEEAKRSLRDAEDAADEARENLYMASMALRQILSARRPAPEELTYAHSRCVCGARMAYWGEAGAKQWECSEALLGLDADGSHSEPLPFVFWSVQVDREAREPR